MQAKICGFLTAVPYLPEKATTRRSTTTWPLWQAPTTMSNQ